MDRFHTNGGRTLRKGGWILLFFVLSSAQGAPVFTKLTVNSDPSWDRVRIFLNTKTEPRQPGISHLNHPPRVRITLDGTLDGIDPGTVRLADSFVRYIEIDKASRGRKVVLTAHLRSRAAGVLTKYNRNDRQRFFYIDILIPRGPIQPRWTPSEAKRAKRMGKPVVVIDPGHGGYDPGAISADRYRSKEKDICLAIGRKTYEILRRRGKVYPVLTRFGDYYPTLDERVDLICNTGADLFVSIHADASPNRRAKGFGVWVIDRSRRDVNSDARTLLKFGWQHLLAKYSSRQESIMMTRQQQFVVQETRRAARAMVYALDRIPGIENRGVKTHEKKLRVLRHDFSPAILVETGFLSNRSDASRLRRPSYQKRLAEAVAEGIESYFSQREKLRIKPPLSADVRITFHDKKGAPSPLPVETFSHRVRRGETLTGLARRYGVEKEDILIASNLPLTRQILYTGEILKIPKKSSSSRPAKGSFRKRTSTPGGKRGKTPEVLPKQRIKIPVKTYTVDDSDNWLKIAHRHGISISELLDLNGFPDGRTPKPGETILVPANNSSLHRSLVGSRSGERLLEHLEQVWEVKKEGKPMQTADGAGQPDERKFLKYRVKPGDNLSEIANNYGTTVEELRRLNNLRSDLIRVRQILRVPVGKQSHVEHRVQKGENLEMLSKIYGTSIEEIRQLNNIRSDRIVAGEVIRVR